jgi:alpha-mannosidase
MNNNKRVTKLRHQLALLKKTAWHETNEEVTLRHNQTEAKAHDVLQENWQNWPTLPADFAWGLPQKHHWYAGEFERPVAPSGITSFLRLKAKNEILLGRTDPQCQVYLNGEICQAFDGYHRELFLPKSIKHDQSITIHINAYTAEIERQLGIKLVWCEQHDAAAQLYYDLANGFDAMERLAEHDVNRHAMLNIIDDALKVLDARARGDAFSISVTEAQNIADGLFDLPHAAPTISAVGHTHIDVAWLWPVAQTREKMIRSMSTACKLLDENPDFVFMYNQCVLFDWLKEDAPELFERIKAHVKSGQFEIEGGMWLEPDVNIISGESLVRQILKGVRFQRDEFGVTPRILWLPDTFGYTAAIPQLMKGANLDVFVTSKCSWNDTNRMPYDLFEWQGIDGSNVMAYLITAQKDDKGHRGDHRTDYGPHLDVSTTVGTWNRFEPKSLTDNVLMPFGHGDGGGGPSEEMIENARRLQKGLPGAPKIKMEGIVPFFDRLREKFADNEGQLPRWVGELYLEYHRGTLTSLAKNKRNNANGEHVLRELELLAVYAKANGQAIDKHLSEIDALWRILLLNQFHDILPGTSIPEVYEDSDRDYAAFFARAAALKTELKLEAFGERDVLLNSAQVERSESYVQFEKTDGANAVVFTDQTHRLQQAHRANGEVFAVAPSPKLAPGAWQGFSASTDKPETPTTLSVSEQHLENKNLRVEINAGGDVTSIFDKIASRELLQNNKFGNRLTVYEDKPLNWDAWDIDWFYEEKSWPVEPAHNITIVETGPHRAAIKIERQYRKSKITQIYALYKDGEQLEIDFYADWQESQSLLKAEFDFDIQTDQLTSQIQFGHVTRATHRNTSWDAARFEASMHRWVAFKEPDYAIGILNDVKYGYSAKDTQFGLTLIKSGIYPHPTADQETHYCRYAIRPQSGATALESINQKALDFARPLKAELTGTVTTENSSAASLLSGLPNNVVLHAIKPSDDGTGVIFRMCEEMGQRTKFEMQLSEYFSGFEYVNLLEEALPTAKTEDGDTRQISFKPFEIVSIKALWR